MSNLIKDTCKQLGITQKELACQIGVHEMTMSRWSRGVEKAPDWALKLFDLMQKQAETKNIIEKAEELSELIKKLKK